MRALSPPEILEAVSKKGEEKAGYSNLKLTILGIFGGMYISLGFLTYIRVIGSAPAQLGSLANFIGGCVFPIGIIMISIAGGELLTGNLMVMPIAWLDKRITLGQLIKNWVVVFFTNMIGALFVAYVFGHFVGLTEQPGFLEKTIAVGAGKVKDPFLVALVSGIGCNIFVAMSIWMPFAAKDVPGKILAMWFPIMAFVSIGFQHLVANMFIIAAAMMTGKTTITVGQYAENMVSVLIGNTIGAAIVVGLAYYLAYGKDRVKTA